MHWGVDTLISSRQGPDAFQFQRISKILRGYCSWGEDRKRLEDEEEMKRWQAEIRRGRNKRESWKEELKARDGEHTVEENCMHVSFSCCMFLDNCIHTLSQKCFWCMLEYLLCAICLPLISCCCRGRREEVCCRKGTNSRSLSAGVLSLTLFVPFSDSDRLWFCFRTQKLQKATLCLQKSHLI